MCYRRALRATRPLRLLALSKRGRVSIAGGQLQVHVCTRLYGPELRGRHRRMRQEPVQTRLLQEHSRIVQVSRRTTSLTLSLSLSLSLLYISSFIRKLRSHAPLSDKTKGEATKSKLSRLLLSFLFLSRLHFANDTTLNINFYHQFPTPGLSRHPTERFWGENRYRYEGYDRFRCLKFCYKIYFFIIIIITFIHFPRTSF